MAAKPRTFYIATYGCQMNVADSSTLVAGLVRRGYQRVDDEQAAELVILNTCSVREKAEQRVIGRLGDMQRLKRERPHLQIAVVGCMAQRLGEELAERMPHVNYVLGTDRLFELPDVIDRAHGETSVLTAFGHEDMDDIEPTRETAYSGFVTISRGCDNHCSYCIVPSVRGEERSHSARHIIDNVKRMVDQGVVEIMLLGQNVNSYRHNDVGFPMLLQMVARRTGIKRIRFMTSHPKDLSRRLVDAIADEEKLMPHIHLPLQAGNNRVLRRMGRMYTVEHYLKIIDYIRDRLDYASITTDLIVGFPTETEPEFQETLAAVRRVQYDSAFMFRYSLRPGTPAARLDDDVPEEVKIRRLNTLIEMQQKISYERNQREVGRLVACLVEGASRRSEEKMRARTDGNKTVLFTADPSLQPGMIVPVRVTSADAFTLHGDIEGAAA